MSHKAILKPESDYDKLLDRFYLPNIRGVYGIKGHIFELQALIFSDEKFTAKQAKDWCKAHKFKVIEWVKEV